MSKRETLARIAALNRQRQTMRLANQFLRSGNDAALARLGFTQDQVSRLREPDAEGVIGFSPVTIRNIRARILRLQARLQ